MDLKTVSVSVVSLTTGDVYFFELHTVETEREHVSVFSLIWVFPVRLMRECIGQLF